LISLLKGHMGELTAGLTNIGDLQSFPAEIPG
jgi:hypothetical protein